MARNVTIDIMKGIGIMAVIAGHTNPDIITSKIISSFHMPLFFIISGILIGQNGFGKTLCWGETVREPKVM